MPKIKKNRDPIQTVKLPHSQWVTLLGAVHLVHTHAKVLLSCVYGKDGHGPACWAMELAAFSEVNQEVLDQLTGAKKATKPTSEPATANHAHEISRNNLATIPTPAGTDSWRPVPHIDVVETLTERAANCGLKIKSERFAVLDGSLYPRPGEQITVPGARLFGTLDFAPIPGMPFPEGCTPSAGIRNSHDKSFALSILSGARVFVCANGVLSAEHIIARKHTSGIDLAESIDAALDAFMESIRGFNEMYERLHSRTLTRMKAQSMIVEMARAGAFSSSDIVPVVLEFENPRHDAFKDRNAWSLYQATTEVMKKQSPARQVEGFKALNVAMAALN